MFENLPADEQKAYIDLDTALGRVRGNKKIFVRMLKLYLASEEFDGFEKAMEAGDTARAAEVAHAIKGMSANLGLDKVAATSADLMSQLRGGAADPQTLEDYRKALEITLDGVKDVAAKMEAEL